MGESRVDSMMGDLITTQTNPTVGLLASRSAVRIRIAARAESIDEANALIDPVDKAIRERLPEIAVDAEDDKLENKG